MKLAGIELGRVPQRAASVAMPLVLASAIVAGAVVLIGFFHLPQLRGPGLAHPGRPDHRHRAPPAGPDVLKAAQQPEVNQLLPISGAGSGITVNGARMGVAGVDPARLDAYLQAVHQPAATKFGPDSALVGGWRLGENKVAVGQQITISGLAGGPRTVTVAGTLPAVDLDFAEVLVGDPSLAPVSAVVVTVKSGFDQGAYRSAVLAALPSSPTVTVTTASQSSDDTQRNLDLAAVMLMVLLSLSVKKGGHGHRHRAEHLRAGTPQGGLAAAGVGRHPAGRDGRHPVRGGAAGADRPDRRHDPRHGVRGAADCRSRRAHLAEPALGPVGDRRSRGGDPCRAGCRNACSDGIPGAAGGGTGRIMRPVTLLACRCEVVGC
ncbi:ABC transporter permease component [Kutzneria sp. 744]|nr:ABC transporter permease component [Kutzneria sp. 744]